MVCVPGSNMKKDPALGQPNRPFPTLAGDPRIAVTSGPVIPR